MAKASEQFRQSDVTLWSIVALVCGGLAIFGANVAAVLPQSVISVLHQPRLAGATLDTLRMQVADLREQSRRLKTDNELLLSRFSLQEQASTETKRRVGALEVTVPNLLEALPDGAGVDRNSVTASIDTPDYNATTFDAEGGRVVVRRTPLPGTAGSQAAEQPLPKPITAKAGTSITAAGTYGIALGASLSAGDAQAHWTELTDKLGPLLFGLTPLLVDEDQGSTQRLLAGPVANVDQARDLCDRLERVSIACTPMPYIGEPLTRSAVESSEGG